MECEGQQVEDGKDSREVLLAVAEIVFEVVALGFQGVEAFVLDLPAPELLLSPQRTLAPRRP